MNSNEFRAGLVFVTTPSRQVAEQLAETLISERLAACVSFHEINSIYRWQGELQRDVEVQLVIKTNLNLCDRLISRIREFHTYGVPEVVAVPIVHGLPDYLKWMSDQVD